MLDKIVAVNMFVFRLQNARIGTYFKVYAKNWFLSWFFLDFFLFFHYFLFFDYFPSIVSIFVVGESYPNGPRTSNEAIETKKKPNRAPDHSTDFKTSFDQVSTRNTYR